jgi:hypothetical protein
MIDSTSLSSASRQSQTTQVISIMGEGLEDKYPIEFEDINIYPFSKESKDRSAEKRR